VTAAPRWALLAALLFVLAALPAAALAGVLATSDPAPGEVVGAPPERVRVALDVPVETAFLELEVMTPRGRVSGVASRDPRDPRAFLAPVRPAGRGVYGVAWRAFGRDGHPHGDLFHFEVGQVPDESFLIATAVPPSDRGALGVLARLLALTGTLGLGGLVALRWGVLAPAWRAGGVVPPVGASDPEGFRSRAGAALEAVAGRWWAVWWGFAAAAAAGLALLPVVLLRALGEGPGALGTLLGDTRWGLAWIAQAALLAAAIAAALVLLRGDAWRAPAPAPAWALALGGPPALALVAISWSGHAAAGDDAPLDIAIDAVHNGATAAWLGGLAALLALVPAAGRALASEDRTRLLAGVVVRFSALAVTAVALLVATGIYRALVELSSLGDLLDTGYGQALLAKLIVFALLLCGGAYNRLVLHPRLERAAIGLDPDDRGAAARLRTSVRAELALAVGLMVAVAILVSIPPPA